MSKKRVLFVTQEMEPYTVVSEISKLVAKLPTHTQGQGYEIRVLMPKYGLINERRHRLHEVVRLSGMNIIVNDDDFPLIIKVASLPGSRLQVYFLDNEEFFKRKFVFKDEDEKPFEDNSDRMVFFCKGVMETVKKFGWPPDIIHCHGWLTSLIPLYLKTVYKDEPIFQQAKILYSIYNNEFEQHFTEDFFDKALINNLDEADLENYRTDGAIDLNMGAIKYLDGAIKGHEDLAENVNKALENVEYPVLEYQDEETYLNSYVEYYKSFIEEIEEE